MPNPNAPTEWPMKNKLLQLTCDTLEASKARDIVALDVSRRTTVADYMVIATGMSKRHICGTANKIVEGAKEQGFRPLGVEGMDTGEWVLVDLGDIIVHVMREEVRQFYMLENLWNMEAVTS